MSSFDEGFYKKAGAGSGRGAKILKALAIGSGAIGGAAAGAGSGMIARGLLQDKHESTKQTPTSLKDRALAKAPIALALAGAALGGARSHASFKTAFDQGFSSRRRATVKTALSLGEYVIGQIAHRVGDTLGGNAGSLLGDQMEGRRLSGIREKTRQKLTNDPRFAPEDLSSLSSVTSMTGLGGRSTEVAAGTGLLLFGHSFLQASTPLVQKGPSWAAQIASKIRGIPKGPGSVMTMAAGALVAGAIGAMAGPVLSQAAGSLAAKIREGDIDKGVDRYYLKKKASAAISGFDGAKIAASLTGVMPGITSGLRTTKSFGKIRTARPVSGQSIGPRAKPNPTPSPTKPPSSGAPGGSGEQVSSARVPQASSYGNRLMGRWI